ncbi:GDSL esterase/lipase At5g03810-like [Dioscorea cayenensis subsp. rotundata]|uniref:GDSL esterase/lipase At5g03810-like n=1 Tax=Dioscorea cayennensis subsp. rotundata TaxID=55577 RepID=A0AB40BUC9_DIOCR|nr:GDSL esterase/lipase At5g03810-like [Dioscorea cayenensis subsp. rotundata]
MSMLCKLVVLVMVIAMLVDVSQGQALVPAVIIFGDSVMDVGNNNHLLTLVKANFPPYGRDYTHHNPTGRFCNGKLASDFTVENLGFDSYPPAYLSKEAIGSHLLNGTNFASAASGYLDSTSKLYSAISLSQQLKYYKEYQEKVTKMVGKKNASDIFTGALYLLSEGSSDYIQNYYINPLLYKLFTPDQFADLLLHSFTSFIQDLYKLGARRIGVTSLPPLGCLPAAVTLFGEGANQCVKRLNNDAILFNKKINNTAKSLTKKHSDLKLVIFDIYSPLLDLIKHPEQNGFFEARKACCGTGTIETSLLCNEHALGTCANATSYVFWDSVHPTEATNKFLSDNLLSQGIDLIS